MKHILQVNGPYIHSTGILKGRRYVNIIYDDGSKTSMLYSRYLMEQHLGRELTFDETVDHIDEDKTNDDLSNLQVLSRSDNIVKSKVTEWFHFDCPVCGSPTKKLARQVRHNKKQGKAGPFCGKVCARRYQLGSAT